MSAWHKHGISYLKDNYPRPIHSPTEHNREVEYCYVNMYKCYIPVFLRPNRLDVVVSASNNHIYTFDPKIGLFGAFMSKSYK